MIISGSLSNKAVKLSLILQKRRKYTIDKTREELEKEYAESCEKLKQYQHKEHKLENWIKYYDKKQEKTDTSTYNLQRCSGEHNSANS